MLVVCVAVQRFVTSVVYLLFLSWFKKLPTVKSMNIKGVMHSQNVLSMSMSMSNPMFANKT